MESKKLIVKKVFPKRELIKKKKAFPKINKKKVIISEDPEHLAGTSGFYYDWWFYNPSIGYPAFYPKGLPKKEALTYYSSQLPIVELNSTYYKLPSRETVLDWYNKTPKDFKFMAKLSRQATTYKKLIDFPELFDEFWFDRVEHLEDKLSGILIQMPPNFIYYPNKPVNLERIRTAGNHTLSLGSKLFVPIFIEFRDPSWFNSDVYEVLEDIGWSLVPVHLNNEMGAFGKMPTGLTPPLDEIPITLPNHIYFRFHGTWPLPYQGGYTFDELSEIWQWTQSQKIPRGYFLFNNTDSIEGEIFSPLNMILKQQGHTIINPELIQAIGALIPHAVFDAKQMNLLVSDI